MQSVIEKGTVDCWTGMNFINFTWIAHDIFTYIYSDLAILDKQTNNLINRYKMLDEKVTFLNLAHSKKFLLAI